MIIVLKDNAIEQKLHNQILFYPHKYFDAIKNRSGERPHMSILPSENTQYRVK